MHERMECKIVVSTKDGSSYNIEAKDEQARLFLGKKIGDVVHVGPLGLKGYDVKITGGSDKSGFPMRADIPTSGRAIALFSSSTTGYRQKRKGVRKKKTVMGNTVTEAIAQINVKVVKEGAEPIPKLLGLPEKAEGEKKPAEAKAEQKPSEKKA